MFTLNSKEKNTLTYINQYTRGLKLVNGFNLLIYMNHPNEQVRMNQTFQCRQREKERGSKEAVYLFPQLRLIMLLLAYSFKKIA